MVGRIEFLFIPKFNIFFNDVENVFFRFKSESGETFLCSGYSFFITSGLKIEIIGKKNEKGVFEFSCLEIDLKDTSTKKILLEYVFGKKKFSDLLLKYSINEIFNKISANPYYFLENEKIFINNKNDRLNTLLKIIRMNKLKDKINVDLSITEKSKLFKLSIKEINKCLENPFLLQSKLGFSYFTCLKLFKEEPKEKWILNALTYDILKTNFISGNTVINYENFKTELKKKSHIEEGKVNDFIKEELNKGRLVKEKEFIMSEKTFEEVSFLHQKIFSLVKEDKEVFINRDIVKEIEERKGVKLGEEQIEAVMNSSKNMLSVITGGPGTGKTTILSCVLEILSRYYKKEEIALCSPTGKASIRMSESTGYEASTIHTLLRVIPNEEKEAEDFNFFYNEINPLPFKLVVIDESSMIDQKLAVNLFKALRNDVHVIFVGDINQLPPVGAGYFFRDLINLKVPCVKLLKTYRQSGDSTIIKLAKEIQDGKICSFKSNFDFGFKNLNTIDEIVDIYLRGVKEKGIENIEILCPQNKGELGTVKLNNFIIDKMIPSSDKEIRMNGFIFREGARVIQTKNDYSLGVINGQLGTLKKIDLVNKTVTIEYDGKEFEYNSEQMKNVALGYSITIHKSQGSEWKYVIEICSKIHKMNTKPLVYTGITRAKEKLIIVGDKETFLSSPKKEAKEVMSFL